MNGHHVLCNYHERPIGECNCEVVMKAELTQLRQRLEEAERELQHQREYDERVPDPRHHKYFNFDCSSGCKFLVQKGKITALETTLAAIREKCEQAENGSLRTTIRAIHQLASGGTP